MSSEASFRSDVGHASDGGVGLKRHSCGTWAVSDNGSTSALQAEGRGSTPLRSTGQKLRCLTGRRDGHTAPLAQWIERSPDKRKVPRSIRGWGTDVWLAKTGRHHPYKMAIGGSIPSPHTIGVAKSARRLCM